MNSLIKKIKNYFPLTFSGLFSLVLCFLLYRFSQEHKDLILNTASIVLGMMISFLLIQTSAVYAWYRVKLKKQGILEALEIEVGQESIGKLYFPLFPKTPLLQFEISWLFPQVKALELILDQQQMVEFFCFEKRGRYDNVVRDIEIKDIFGFTAISWQWEVKQSLKILPACSQVHTELLQREQLGEGFYDMAGSPEGDLVEMRRYQPGDPLKLVIWKAFAKTGKLLIRAPEKSFEIKHDMVAYFIASPKDEASATTVRAFLEGDALGEDFLFFVDGCAHACSDKAQALEALIDSSKAMTGHAFPQVLGLESSQQRGITIFLSAEPQSIAFALSIATSLPAPPIFIISMGDRDFDKQPASWLYRLGLKQNKALGSSMKISEQELLQAYQSLLSVGKLVKIFAQPEGRMWSDFELDNLRAHHES
jgi:hypothetical protein